MSREDAVKAAKDALVAHWKDMHTNESHGLQEMLAENVVRALEEAMGGENHILLVNRPDGWIIQHPLAERWAFTSPEFSCPWVELFEADPDLAWFMPTEPGRYVMHLPETPTSNPIYEPEEGTDA